MNTMQTTLKTIGMLFALALAVLMLVLQMPILGIAAFGCLGLLIASGSHWGKDRKQVIILSEHLSHESRRILRPVRRLAAFNRELARKHRDALLPDHQALVETENVLRQCIRWLEVRDRLVESLQQSESTHMHLERLMERLESCQSASERLHLELAAQHDRSLLEVRHQTERQIRAIDGRILHAKYSMEYLKTILSLAAMTSAAEESNPLTQGSGLSTGR